MKVPFALPSGDRVDEFIARVRVLGRRGARLVSDPRLRRWLEGAAAVSETFAFLPIVLPAVALLHVQFGPAPTLAGLSGAYAIFRRPSIRALAWMAGGLYLSWLLLSTASTLDSLPQDPVAGPAEVVVALALSALGLGTFILTFGLPAARAATRWLPRLTQTATIWTVELGKSSLAGATIGIGLAKLVPSAGPMEQDQDPGRLLLIGLATAIGLVVGGLVADSRVRSRVNLQDSK